MFRPRRWPWPLPWSNGRSGSRTFVSVSGLLSAYLVAVSAYLIFRVILRERRVSGDTLFGGFAVYLAVGVLFGMAFTAIARAAPHSFEPPQPVIDGETSMYYYIFVTLTTLGYGDIAPVSDAAKVLSTREAVVGVVLLAALVGRIVGLLVAGETASPGNADPDS